VVSLPWRSLDMGGASTTFVRERIGSSDAYKRAVEAQAKAAGRSVEDVNREARKALKEMVAADSSAANEAWSKLGGWLSRAYEISTKAADIDALRQVDPSETQVFLPNHRSYLDPFVLRLVLERAGFPPNYVLGGSNLSFFPLGTIGQHTGTVFIRRQFKDSPVYKAMLGVYLGYLVEQGANLEWYIEGGRTRTGKLRPPRMGILSYLLDAFDDSEVEDMTFVPVSIIYDQQHEVGAIADEESGGTKKPESFKWALRYARAQGTRRGKVHVRFAEPFSLMSCLEELQVVRKSGNVRAAVPKVAFEVANRINSVTPVTPAAVATLVLLDSPDRALTEAQMRAGALPLAEYMGARHLPISSGLDLERAQMLTERMPSEGLAALSTLIREGVVTKFDGGPEAVFAIAPDRHLEAAFYRNTLSHFFVTRSILELALVAAAESGNEDITAVAWSEALALRDLLKFEFFFTTKRQFVIDLRAELDLAWPNWEEVHDPDLILPGLAELTFRAAPRILTPFLEAYSVLGERLAALDPDKPVDSDALVAECMGLTQQRVLQRQVRSRESVSKDLFKNALMLADNRGLLDAGTPDLDQRRRAFADELATAVRRVGVLRAMTAVPGTPAPMGAALSPTTVPAAGAASEGR
jgi:glycerol-3-phosphate O-acyltransferase